VQVHVAVAVHVPERGGQRAAVLVGRDLGGPVLEPHPAAVAVQLAGAPAEVEVRPAVVVHVGDGGRAAGGDAGFPGDVEEPLAAVVLEDPSAADQVGGAVAVQVGEGGRAVADGAVLLGGVAEPRGGL